MAKHALTRNLHEVSLVPYVRDLEKEMLDKIKNLGIGPGGLGGSHCICSKHRDVSDPYRGTSSGSQYLLSREPSRTLCHLRRGEHGQTYYCADHQRNG